MRNSAKIAVIIPALNEEQYLMCDSFSVGVRKSFAFNSRSFVLERLAPIMHLLNVENRGRKKSCTLRSLSLFEDPQLYPLSEEMHPQEPIFIESLDH